MSEDFVICVSMFSNRWDADMARMTLETHGIDSFVSADGGEGASPYLQLAAGVRLMVRESESEQASEILNELKDNDNDGALGDDGAVK